MPRAHRHYIPGCVWHITHRCHKQEFLLKFVKDRRRWRYWLFEAKKRYGLSVLNYIVTSNHIHLLVLDTGHETISKSLQLIAGRTGQEFNTRKKRKGSFWEDRYHATAVEKDAHLAKCLVYIDLNMVRAGVVKHPSKYDVCGYNEIQNPPERYSILDWDALLDLFGCNDTRSFQQVHYEWVESELRNELSHKNSLWSESVAVGSEAYMQTVKEKLGARVRGRTFVSKQGLTALREPLGSYSTLFDRKNVALSVENSYFIQTN